MRKIALPMLVLVVAVGAYWLASRGDRPAATPSTMSAFAPRSPSTSPMQVIRGGDLPVTGGEHPRTRIYDPVTGRVKFEVSAESWQPVSEQVYHIVKPDIRIHAPGGQVSYITADQSEMEVVQAGRKNPQPRRGRLRGNVRVVVDRSTRAWREQNPARAARDDHPEHLIHISLDDEARFDMESSRLTADGRVTLRSEDADVSANPGKDALLLTWDQLDNRADYLRLQYGGRMELRREGFVDFNMPGLSADRGDAMAAAPRTPRLSLPSPRTSAAAAARTSQTSGDVSTGDEVAANLRQAASQRPSSVPRNKEPAASAPAASQPQQRLGDAYAAAFTDNVKIRQSKNAQETGGLDCDKLELVFDFGREQRQSAGSPLGVAASRPARTGAPAQPTEITRLQIEWSGPLELRSVAAAPPEFPGGRFDIMATGSRVHLRDVQGEATCRRLIFRKGPSAVWLTGDDAGPARIWSGTQREIVAREIMIDRARGQGRLAGRGFLRDESATRADLSAQATPAPSAARAEPLEIRWTDHARIALGSVDRLVTDYRTRAGRIKTSDYLRAAEFHGEASIVQGRQSLAGDRVAVQFSPPRREGALADAITQLDADGRVFLRDEDQRISSRSLHVDLEPSPQGRSLPHRAVATGDVRVEQPGRVFAADHLIADFAARTESTADGSSAEKVILRRAVATRRVAIRDDGQELEADADQLDAAFDPAGRLARAVLIGPGRNGWAYSHQRDYAVNGHHVTIDLEKQEVAVPDRGHAVFVTRSDFDGRALREPTAVNVTFSNGMTLNGRKNVGIFSGQVHTSTDTHELTCDQRLVVRFFDRGGPDAEFISDNSFELTRQKKSNDSPLAALADWTRRRIDPSAADATAKRPRVRKQPDYVIAEGNVAALSTDYDEKGLVRSRMRIAGPTLEADLRRQHFLVPGRGNLAIEDYRPPKPRSAINAASASPGPVNMLGGESGGPSQTAFFWANGMSFDNHDAIATFDRNVQMVHRSGSKLVLAGELAAAMKADVAALRLGPGREATLSCDNLLVQFTSTQNPPPDGRGSEMQARAAAAPPPGAVTGPTSYRDWNDLRRLVATGRVHLQDNTRTLMGESLCLESPANIVTLRGSSRQEAVLMDESEQTQHVRAWRGQLIRWNRTTGDIEAPQPQVTVR